MTTEQAVLATLAYHKIFRYPLKIDELHSLLMYKKNTKFQLNKAVNNLIKMKKIIAKEGFIELKHGTSNVKLRKERERYSKYKKIKAAHYSKILSHIQTVEFVAVTGALAMNNSTKNDDIDLLVITSRNRLFTTRFFANLFLLPFKRSPNSKKQKDRACLNIFIDEIDLSIKDKNLYTAHEIAQMQPIYSKHGTYTKFIKANTWIYKYLPNWTMYPVKEAHNTVNISNYLLFEISNFLESKFKFLQLSYMRSKQTTELITNTQLFFHPNKTKFKVIEAYKKALQQL